MPKIKMKRKKIDSQKCINKLLPKTKTKRKKIDSYKCIKKL